MTQIFLTSDFWWCNLHQIKLTSYMKTSRFLAGILLLVTGILHILMYIQTPDNPGIMGVLAFGVIYCIIGLLLFNKNVYPLFLGLIIPIIGMTLSIIKFGIPSLFSMLALFKVIGVVVVFLCGYILLRQRNQTQVK